LIRSVFSTLILCFLRIFLFPEINQTSVWNRTSTSIYLCKERLTPSHLLPHVFINLLVMCLTPNAQLHVYKVHLICCYLVQYMLFNARVVRPPAESAKITNSYLHHFSSVYSFSSHWHPTRIKWLSYTCWVKTSICSFSNYMCTDFCEMTDLVIKTTQYVQTR